MPITQQQGGDPNAPAAGTKPQPPAAPKAPAWYTATDPSVPGWENQQLNQLFSSGQLSGIPPELLAAIDQAESSGQGGSINPEGYGGWFGLGANTNYGGGFQDTPSLLSGTNQSAFDMQARTAAYEFAKLLQGTGGNPYTAERNYQGGSSEGDNIFAQLGIPQGLTGYQPTSINQTGGNTALSGVVGGLQAGNALANTALSQQNAIGQAQQGITDTQLLQQLQDTLKALGLSGQSLGIQKTGLQEQGAYEKGQYGLNVAQIQQALGNLATQYGLTKEGFGLQGQEARQNYTNSLNQVVQGAAGSGITNTGSPRQSQQQLFQGLQNAEQGIGIQSGQAYRNYLASRQQYGDQLKSLGLNYGYQQQQLQNQLAQLGISQQQLGLQGTEAQQQYATGTQSAANQLADLLNSTTLAQAQNQEGLSSQLGQLIQQLQQAGMGTGGL